MTSNTPTERRDARGRIMGGDPRYGQLCACGNLKDWQARTCWTCDLERRRPESYWRDRTCPECNGPKTRLAARCVRCKHERARLASPAGMAQPADHPWRKLAA